MARRKQRKPRDLFEWAKWQPKKDKSTKARLRECVRRDAEEPQSYLAWHDDVPYMVVWKPGKPLGLLEVRVADEDFAQVAADPWHLHVRMEAAAAGLEDIVTVNIRMHHDAEKTKDRFESQN